MKNNLLYRLLFFAILSILSEKPILAQSLKEHFVSEIITDLSFKFKGEFELVTSLQGGKLELYQVKSELDGVDVFVYVIIFPQSPEIFIDYVFFEDEREWREVVEYFKSRWLFLIEGLEKGYIHFEENFDGAVKHFYGTIGASNTARGSQFGNTHFSRFRLSRLQGLIKEFAQEANDADGEGGEVEGGGEPNRVNP